MVLPVVSGSSMTSSSSSSERSERGPRPVALCIASSGGHFVQMGQLLPAFEGYEVMLGATGSREAQGSTAADAYVPDASRWSKWRLLWSALACLKLVWTVRPALVVSTGAAPGYFAVRLGHLLGARTIWVDSLANVDCISMAGRYASRHVDLMVTQWEHLEGEHGAVYLGSVL